MARHLLIPAALFFLCAASGYAAHPEAGSVLILVNDAAPPEAGTEGKSASVYVGEYYARQRGIPTSHILHLNVTMACCPTSVLDWDNWNLDWTRFDTGIRQPLRKFLDKDPSASSIRYIVTTYGVPVRTWDYTHRAEGLSIDSLIAGINSPSFAQYLPNPYYTPVWNEGRVHFRNFQNPGGWQMYLVTRLDGPSPKIAIGLVDKAIRAESNLKVGDGTAYFDYRNLNTDDPSYPSDRSMINASQLARALGSRVVFNENHNDFTRMIHSAPKTLWAWGWYSGTIVWDGYEFVEGAVGAQLTSYTANSIRTMMPGTWVTLWLNAGITATWGATCEPYTFGYANGDNLFQKFWSGYNFAESAYLSSPFLNHAMIFLGDPLYAPKVFQAPNLALAEPAMVSPTSGDSLVAPGSMVSVTGAGLATCSATNRAPALPLNLCGTSVTMNGQPAPLYYVSPSQINALVPRAISPGQELRLVVTREDAQTGAATIAAERVVPAAPGIFASRTNGVDRAIVQNAAGQSVALQPGGAGVLYASGLGPLDTPLADTAAAPLKSLIAAARPVRVIINGLEQQTFFAGLTPGQFGLYQVNFVLDPQTPQLEGDQNFIWLTVDGAESPHVRISLAQ